MCGAECERLAAAADAGKALRRALDAQLKQANSQAVKQITQIKASLLSVVREQPSVAQEQPANVLSD